MANKPKNQGTAWETAIVKRAKALGMDANRLPLRGQRGEPDLEIISGDWLTGRTIPAVIWKRLVKGKGKKRVPDGEKEVVVLSLDDFLSILQGYDLAPRVLVQAKATERLNVTRVLGDLRDALKQLL